jgi:hypothetical protein
MGWRTFFWGLFVFLVIAFLLVYFFIPRGLTEFDSYNSPVNSNFNVNSSNNLQFYKNMRYQDQIISYKIDNICTLQKRNEIEEAFDIISNSTILTFFPVSKDEEISIRCSNENIVNGNTFVAGEGGVTNVTVVGDYHIIFRGMVLLIRDSNCPKPNVAIHEIFHSLGFNHSINPNNIMYEIMDCKQTIGEEIPQLINELYSIPSLPDLSFEEINAFMNGNYLNANISIRNNGFQNAPSSQVYIYVDNTFVKKLNVDDIEIGFGKKIYLSNFWINNININEIKFEIVGDFDEIDNSNNVYILSVKK